MASVCRFVAVVALTLGAVFETQARSPEVSGEPMSIKEYIHIADNIVASEEDALRILSYFDGMNAGLAVMAYAFKGAGAAPLTCFPPNSRPITVLQYADMIYRERNERPDLWNDIRLPVAHVAFEALRRKFPCR